MKPVVATVETMRERGRPVKPMKVGGAMMDDRTFFSSPPILIVYESNATEVGLFRAQNARKIKKRILLIWLHMK